MFREGENERAEEEKQEEEETGGGGKRDVVERDVVKQRPTSKTTLLYLTYHRYA